MISEEDKKRFEEAKVCNDCLCWHKYCEAECCKIIFLNISLDHFNRHKNFVDIRMVLDEDKKWYYKLRGARYIHGLLRFPKEHCVYTGRRILYVRKCDLLNGLLCMGHPDKKPKLCKVLDSTTNPEDYGFELTDNCLYKYKGVSNNVEEEKDKY